MRTRRSLLRLVLRAHLRADRRAPHHQRRTTPQRALGPAPCCDHRENPRIPLRERNPRGRWPRSLAAKLPKLAGFDVYLAGLGLGISNRETAKAMIRFWKELVPLTGAKLRSTDASLRFR